MTTAEEVLARHFPGMTAEQVDAALSDVPVTGVAAMSAGAVVYLAVHGGAEARAAVSDSRPERVQHERVATAGRALSATLRSSLSIEEATALLGVSRSQISRRLREQSLYAVTVQGDRRLPRWQFIDSRVLPGMSTIVPTVPASLHPLAVATFMTTAIAELDGRSPVQHLASGGAPDAVVDLLESLAHQ